MAITRTTKLKKIEIVPQNPPVMYLMEEVTFDDTEDDSPPIVSNRRRVFQVSHLDNPDDGTYEEITPDFSGEDALIQDISSVLWPSSP